MPSLAIISGVILIAIGLVGYIPSGAMTALIPAYIGAILALCGAVALKPSLRMHAMHAAVAIALLAFLGVGSRLISALLKGGASSLALFTQIATAVVTAAFVVACVRSFTAARKARSSS